jgi:hypothetical protein
VPSSLSSGSEDYNTVCKILNLLNEARAVEPTGREKTDREQCIDPFIARVADLYDMWSWSDDSESNKLVLDDVDPEDPKDTTGFVDVSVSPRGVSRPRLMGGEVKRRGYVAASLPSFPHARRALEYPPPV